MPQAQLPKPTQICLYRGETEMPCSVIRVRTLGRAKWSVALCCPQFHYESECLPYLTVRFEDGSEKQTTLEHLRALGDEEAPAVWWAPNEDAAAGEDVLANTDWNKDREEAYRALRSLETLPPEIEEAYQGLCRNRETAFNRAVATHGPGNVIPWFRNGFKSWQQLASDLQMSSGARELRERIFSEVKCCIRQAHDDIVDVTLVGSLGKDTAVPDLSDIDIVCTFRNFDPTGYQNYLNSIQGALLQSQIGSSPVRNNLYPGEEFVNQSTTVEARNAHRGAAYLTLQVKGMQVDILPAATEDEAFHSDGRNGVAMFTKLKPDERIAWGCSTHKMAVKFMKAQDEVCKDVVRVAKYWRSEIVKEWPKNAYPISTLLELLVVHAHEKSGATTVRDCFLEFLKLVVNWRGLRIVWDEHYSKSDVPWDEFNDSDSSPYIIDPTNPTRNIGQRLQDWKPFQRHARELMQELIM